MTREKQPDTAVLRASMSSIRETMVLRHHDELEQLRKVVCCRPHEAMLVTITGEDGSGKTALVEALVDTIERERSGIVVTTQRFDVLKKAVPSRVISNAFFGVVQALLKSDGPEIIEEINHRLVESLEADHVVLSNFLREVKEILQAPSRLLEDDYLAKNQRACGTFAFGKILEIVGSLNRSVVLIFENIHWADKDTIERLSSLMYVCSSKNTTLLCTSTHSMEEFDHHRKAAEIRMRGMSFRETEEMAKDRTAAIGDGVVDKIFELTRGDCAFTDQTIHYLLARSAFGHPTEVEASLRGCKKAEDIVRRRFESLDERCQKVLQYASLMGSAVDKKALCKVLSAPIGAALQAGLEHRFLVTSKEGRTLEFANDYVHRAIKDTIPRDALRTKHYHIGKTILRSLSDDDIASGKIYEEMDQLHRGEEHVKSRSEREFVASLCLKVSQAAVKLSSFRVALIYLEFGIRLVDNRKWKDFFDLNLALHNACIEIMTSVGNKERAEKLQETVFQSTTCFNERMNAKISKVNTLSEQGRVRDAVEEGLDMLKHMGVSLEIQPRLSRLVLTFWKTKRALKHKSDETILCMPVMTDSLKLAAMQLIVILVSSAYQLNNLLFPDLVLRATQYTLEHGLCGASSVIFALYGMLQCRLKNEDEGYRYGRLALRLLDEKRCTAFTARVYTIVYSYTFNWKVPYRQLVEPVKMGYAVGMETGDIDFAPNCMGWSAGLLPWNAGVSNSDLVAQLRSLLALLRSQNQQARLDAFFSFERMVVNLGTGYDAMSEEQLNDRYREYEVRNHWNHWQNALTAYFYRDFLVAESECDKAMLDKGASSVPEITNIHMTQVLIAVALVADGETRSTKRRRLTAARKSIKMLQKFATRCPENCLNRLAVAEADYIAITKGVQVDLFMKAAGISLATGWTMGCALSHELWGRHLLREGDHTESLLRLQEATCFYRKWGAGGKVTQLHEEFPELLKL